MIDLEEVKEYIKENGLDVKSRKRHIVDQRSYLCCYMRVNDMSLTQIGEMFNQHYATVIHSLGKYEALNGTIGYAINVKDLIYRFPISRKIHETLYKAKTVVVRVSPENYFKLQNYRIDNDLKSNEDAIKGLIGSIGAF
tara:strand:+ start:316 stop:732 length:417 start_codon:yes stop_codon:yes gene_type:complete